MIVAQHMQPKLLPVDLTVIGQNQWTFSVGFSQTGQQNVKFVFVLKDSSS